LRYLIVTLSALLLTAFLLCGVSSGKSSASDIVVPNDYPTIQAAVDAANDGDTIYVKAGTYRENVVVNKMISLIGEDPNTTVIDGVPAGGTLVSVTRNNVTISGLTIGSSPARSTTGIYLSTSNFSRIEGNVITGCDYGVTLDLNSSNNLILSNYIAEIYYSAIDLRPYSRGNSILNNTIYYCYFGIQMRIMANESVIFHNRFIRCIGQVDCQSSPNIWDDGYPSGGNLWTGFVGRDLYQGPNQDILGSDGICDAPIQLNGINNVDRYPLYVPGNDANVRFYLKPSSLTVWKGQTFNVTVKLENMPEYPGFVGLEFHIQWNSSILNGVGIEDTLFRSVTPEDEQTNIWKLASVVSPGVANYAYLWQDTYVAYANRYGPIWGNYSVATIMLRAVGEGNCTLIPVVVKAASANYGEEEVSHLIYVRGNLDGSLLNVTVMGSTIEVKNRSPGDCNGDDKVDIMDTIVFSHSFGSNLGDLRYEEAADQNLDGVVDMYDVLIVAANFGKVYT
jgi:parallel beta-helix repeat protein